MMWFCLLAIDDRSESSWRRWTSWNDSTTRTSCDFSASAVEKTPSLSSWKSCHTATWKASSWREGSCSTLSSRYDPRVSWINAERTKVLNKREEKGERGMGSEQTLTFFPPTFPRGNMTFSDFFWFSCWKWRHFTNFTVEKYFKISIAWRKTFSFSFSALFFSQIFKKTTKSFFAWREEVIWQKWKKKNGDHPSRGSLTSRNPQQTQLRVPLPWPPLFPFHLFKKKNDQWHL